MNYTKLRIKKNLINRECLIKKPYSFWSENKSFQEIITTQKMINQTDKAAENSSNVISESPSVLKRSNIAFASSEGRFLSMTSTSLLNSSRLSLPSLLLSKFVKICRRLRLWFLIIRLSSPISFFAFSEEGLNLLS